jgi:hypothetical protein
MSLTTKRLIVAALSVFFLAALLVVAYQESKRLRVEEKKEAIVTATNSGCVECHRKDSPALVMEWERSSHAHYGVGCVDCHTANANEVDAWTHEGAVISALVTPKDCARCHVREYDQFSRSHHAKAGQILASLDNVLAEKIAGMPTNNADAVNGCWQCHGTMIKFVRDKDGNVVRAGKENRPVIDAKTWPNSGMGRMNPDSSQGSCHACHSRHSFEAKLSRSPENCGKCHMGPDHPQIEIYNESKHGIAFYANRDKMALDKEKEWVLGRDYSAAPTCATCHISAYMTPQGPTVANSHDIGERISWTLRPAISTKLNLVIFEDGFKEDYPDTRLLPKVGDEAGYVEKVVENEKLVNRPVKAKVKQVITWEERRKKMKGACLNCHNDTYVDNFYKQFDDLVVLYNDKFAKPATKMINDLTADGVLNKNAPFEHSVQWVYYELWHHEGRRARHGASMMGPDYTHWHGMYEVSKHYYEKFLPAVVEAAATKGTAMKAKYQRIIADLMTKDEHLWAKGLSPKEAEELRKTYEKRYNQ